MKDSELTTILKKENISFFSACGNTFGVENCAGIIACALVYGNDGFAANIDSNIEIPAYIAPFAQRNYYKCLTEKLKKIVKTLRETYGGNKSDYAIYCNSRRLNEKKAFIKSGGAVMGRNSLLLNKKYGSLFVAGIIGVPFKIETEKNQEALSEFSLCTNCDKENPPCKKACPTGAVNANGSITNEKCLQWYLSGHSKCFPSFVKNNLKGKLYGCTICQDACIHNKKTIKGENCDLGILPAVMDAKKIALASDIEIKAMFHKTALGLSWLCPDVLRHNAQELLDNAAM